MRERPILFSAPMVRAILAGTKMQTRRVMKDQPQRGGWPWPPMNESDRATIVKHCPYGQTGDRLWVREAWGKAQIMNTKTGETRYQTIYRADNPDYDGFGVRWAPSIHMRREDSRILLEITGVRVERLNDISEADAIEEGCVALTLQTPPTYESARTVYSILWDQINGPGSWAANPWVWVVEFKQMKGGA